MENVSEKAGPPAINPEAIEKQEERTASIGEKSDTSSLNDTDQITPTQHPNPALSLSRTSSKRSNVLARVASRITTRSIKDPGPPPDGGLVAWTQVLCAWFAVMNTWGFVNSFGAFQPYYESILPESASTISWIGSVQAALLFALGMFSGRALDRGWFRPTVLLGIVFQVIGIFSMSAATTFWQLLLTQGLCTGIGGGILFVPVMGLCSTYFSSNRGVALGIVTTGNSVGGVVYPLVVRQLLPRLGFGWAVRVLGFVNVVSMAVVVAFMKPRLPPRRAGPLVDWESVRDVPYVLHVLGMCFFVPPVYCVFYYVASFARDTLDMPYTDSLNLVIILNGIGVPFRILPGYLADRYIGILNILILCLLLTTLTLFTWLSASTLPRYYAWTTIYGALSAAFQSCFPTAIAAFSNDISKTGTRLGMALTVVSLSALVGGPIAGGLLVAGGGYTAPVVWAAGSTGVGVGICVVARGKRFGWGVRVKC